MLKRVALGLPTLALLLFAPHVLLSQPGLGLGDVQLLTKQIAVRAWTVENGLPQSSVTELVKDRKGYVWGATFGGLFRFDGRTIRQFTAADLPAIFSNAVTALTIMPNGDLMVGAPGGSVLRLRDGVLVDSLPRSAMIGAVDALAADGDDGVWVRSAFSVHRYHRGQWEKPLPFTASTVLLNDAQGRLVFVGEHGVVRVDRDGQAQVLAPQPAIRAGTDYGASIDARGRVWIGAADGLWVYEEGRGSRRVHATGSRINTTAVDKAGMVWFGEREGVYRYDPRQPATPPMAMVDAGARPVSMAATDDGLLVIGTLEGMLLLRENAINVLMSRRALPGTESSSIVSSADSTVWVTSSCGDVRRITRSGDVLDSMPRPAALGCTRSLALDRQQRLWAGGDGAIRRRGKTGDRVWVVARGLPGEVMVRPLLPIGDSLLFGVSDGRMGVVGPDDRVSFLAGWEQPTDRAVESLVRAADGAVWVGQRGRLWRVHGGRSVRYDETHGIPTAIPRALHADSRSGVWIGTYGSGLWYFREGGRARAVPVLDQTVSALFEGTSGRLWMPGNRGLTVVTLRSLWEWVVDSTEAPDVRLFSYADGVPEGNVGYPAATRLADGVLAFSSVSGLVVAHTNSVVTAGVTPTVQFDDIRSSFGPLRRENRRYVVAPDARAINASFGMPSFRFGDVAAFRYRVDEGSWIALGNQRDLQLLLSRPGRVRLEVEGRVPGGEWVRAEPVEFEVQPLFLEQRWPRWVLGGLLAALLALFARQRVRTLEVAARAREIELQARRDAALQAEQHQREMAQVSRVAVAGELTASLSHELGQPLAAIVNNAEVARRLLVRNARGGAGDGASPAVDPRVEQALLDVVAQGRRASQVVREFRRFLRRERGEREAVMVRELIDSVTVLLRQEYEAQQVTLTVTVAPGTPVVEAERVLLQQVLVNLLSNALEATRRVRGGQVLVRARPCGNGVRLTVVDNGAGFAADVRRSAFEPFVTTRANGMGMGLAIARRIVEAHGGRIGVGHLASAGAVVSLWLPVSHTPFDRSDGLVPLQVTVHE